MKVEHFNGVISYPCDFKYCRKHNEIYKLHVSKIEFKSLGLDKKIKKKAVEDSYHYFKWWHAFTVLMCSRHFKTLVEENKNDFAFLLV